MARFARLTTVSWSPRPEEDDLLGGNRRQACEMIDRAAQDGPDLICMPEIFAQRGMSFEEAVPHAEPVPGPTTEVVGEAARRNNCYVIATMIENEGDRTYNTAALLGRDGELVGKYHKVRPTIGEIEAGVTPGAETPVFGTDFGRVGMAICYDMNFLEVGQGLCDNEVQVICWPSMYQAGRQLQFWALQFGCYVMSSWGGQLNWIVDMTGEVLATTGYQYPIVTAKVNFDREVLHQDQNREKWDAIRDKYGEGVDIRIAHPEGIFTLASNMEDVTAQDIIEEFELETRRDYYARAKAVRDAALGNGG